MRRFSTIIAIFIIVLLPFSVFGLVIANAQSSGEVNWNTDGNYGFNWNYANQSNITSLTANNLNLQWLFPVPSAPPPYTGHDGVCCTPIIENGIAYMLTSYHHVYALNAGTGAIIWQTQLQVTANASYIGELLHSPFPGHYHNANIFYSTQTMGRPLLWIVSDNYTVFALDAGTGNILLNFSADLSNIPGNFGKYDTITPMAFLDDQRHLLVIGTSVDEGSEAGRGTLLAYNVANNPPTLAWTTSFIPPQDGSNPNWDIQQVQSMTGAWIFNGTGAVNLKTLPQSQLNATLYDDWGFKEAFNGTNSFAGAGAGWGGPWAVDDTTGMLYIGTAEAAPDWNATFRPGPNLWADSVLGIDLNTGRIVWGFQTTVHDLWDYDCSWGVILAQNTVIKGCKNGYIFGLDPATGALKWFYLPPTEARDNSALLNPLSSADMQRPDACYPATVCVQNPPGTGAIESDPAYNPSLGLVYFGTYNSPMCDGIIPVAPTAGAPYDGWGLDFFHSPPLNKCGSTPINAQGGALVNATIYALNVNNGQVVWNYSLPQPYRGGVTTTGDLVFVTTVDGYMTILNAANGQLVAHRLIGGPLETQPAVGTDPSGNIVIIQPVGSDTLGAAPGVTTGGPVVALSLPPSVVSPPLTPQTGINPNIFYASVASAAVLAIISIALAIQLLRRRPKVSSST
jgi:alcohol dehydrogenase (cytochrome c)